MCKILNPCQRAFTSPPECQLLHQLLKRRRCHQPQPRQQLPTVPLWSRQRCTSPQPQEQGQRRRYWPLQQPLPTFRGLLVQQLRHTVPQPLRRHRQATITTKATINRYRLLSHIHLRRSIHPTTLRRIFRTVPTRPVKALIGNARCALFLTSGQSPNARGVDLPYPLD